MVDVRLLTLDETVDLGISNLQETTDPAFRSGITWNDQNLSGLTSIFGLHNFQPVEAFHVLVVQNILGDPLVWCLMLIAVLVCAVVILWALGSRWSSQMISNVGE